MREAINASAIMACVKAVLLLQMPRNGRIILNDFAVIIDNPNGAVRTVREKHRVAPRVARSGKFRFFLTRSAPKRQQRTIRDNNRAVDQIPGWLANEILPAKAR